MESQKPLDLIDRNAALEAICMYCCAGNQDDCPEGRCVDYQLIADLPKIVVPTLANGGKIRES